VSPKGEVQFLSKTHPHLSFSSRPFFILFLVDLLVHSFIHLFIQSVFEEPQSCFPLGIKSNQTHGRVQRKAVASWGEGASGSCLESTDFQLRQDEKILKVCLQYNTYNEQSCRVDFIQCDVFPKCFK
jgi:hypothetical protein